MGNRNKNRNKRQGGAAVPTNFNHAKRDNIDIDVDTGDADVDKQFNGILEEANKTPLLDGVSTVPTTVDIDETTDTSGETITTDNDQQKSDDDIDEELETLGEIAVADTIVDGDLVIQDAEDIIEEIEVSEADAREMEEAEGDDVDGDDPTQDDADEAYDTVDNVSNEDIEDIKDTTDDVDKVEDALTEASTMLSSSDDIKLKLLWCRTESTLLSGIAGVLHDYNSNMSKPMLEENFAVGQQQQLLSSIINIVECEDPDEFKVKMDMLMLFFYEFKDEAYNETKTARFDFLWSGSQKELNTFLKLTYVFAELCDKTTRTTKLQEINMDKAFDASEMSIREEAIGRLKNYFNS